VNGKFDIITKLLSTEAVKVTTGEDLHESYNLLWKKFISVPTDG
jgi:hypothetical protein